MGFILLTLAPLVWANTYSMYFNEYVDSNRTSKHPSLRVDYVHSYVGSKSPKIDSGYKLSLGSIDSKGKKAMDYFLSDLNDDQMVGMGHSYSKKYKANSSGTIDMSFKIQGEWYTVQKLKYLAWNHGAGDHPWAIGGENCVVQGKNRHLYDGNIKDPTKKNIVTYLVCEAVNESGEPYGIFIQSHFESGGSNHTLPILVSPLGSVVSFVY